MNRGSKFLIVVLSSFAMAGTALAQGDTTGGDTTGGDTTGGDTTGGDTTGGDTGAGGDMGAGGDTGTGEMPAEGGAPPMILPKGKFSIMLSLQISLLESNIFKPFSIQPDVFYGVIDKLELGVAHSSYNLTGFWGSLGGGICVTGEDGGCAKVYNGPVGLIARYGFLSNPNMDIAADVGFIIRALDPDVALGAKIGVKGRYVAGKIMIGFNPNLYAGFTQRDAGNKEFINVPVDATFMATPKVGIGLQTGINGPLDGFGDAFAVPISLGAIFMATPNIVAGASFNLLRVAGGDDTFGAADLRGITVFAGYHN